MEPRYVYEYGHVLGQQKDKKQDDINQEAERCVGSRICCRSQTSSRDSNQFHTREESKLAESLILNGSIKEFSEMMDGERLPAADEGRREGGDLMDGRTEEGRKGRRGQGKNV